jgi:HD superfamily phosphodiesterase
MSKHFLPLSDIIQMTQKVGDNWAVAHAKRLIELVKQISLDFPYDSRVMKLAAYMHDWGAFPSYVQKGVEHAVRSRQVVEAEILPHLDLTTDQQAILLETIELHDYRDMRTPKSNEALLLREADMLEFLGAIGLAREFARGPKNVETCYKRVLSRRDGIQGCLTIPRAQEIAQVRFERMNIFIKELEEESLGYM